MITFTVPPPVLSNDERPLAKWGAGASRIVEELGLYEHLLAGKEGDGGAIVRWVLCLIYILQAHTAQEIARLHQGKRAAKESGRPEDFVEAAVIHGHSLTDEDIRQAMEYWASVETGAAEAQAEPVPDDAAESLDGERPGKK